MRTIFLTGFLEPGRCGVGDYTRRLAVGLRQLKHEVVIIALNDDFITEAFEGKQEEDRVEIQVYRLPSCWSTKNRFRQAKLWIDTINPHWISLQYVPFSFQKKGLPFWLSLRMKPFIKERHLHIMFHELWLGMEKESSLKFLVWGWVQKKLVQSMIKKLKPSIIHTQSQLHQAALNQFGVEAEILPLVSNIPLTKDENNGNYTNNKLPVVDKSISMVIFGSLYTGGAITDFLNEIASYAKARSFPISLTFIGRNRSASNKWIVSAKEAGIAVLELGEQPSQGISKILKSSSIGISTTPYPLSEKSGAIVAMHLHNLPVICVSRPYHPRIKAQLKPPTGVFEYKIGNLHSFFNDIKPIYFPDNDVAYVSGLFAHSLLEGKK